MDKAVTVNHCLIWFDPRVRSQNVCPYRLSARSLPFQGEEPGSTPGRDAIDNLMAVRPNGEVTS